MKLVSGGIVGETMQTMANIKFTLERYGASLHHVIKVTVMLADISAVSITTVLIGGKIVLDQSTLTTLKRAIFTLHR
jgi:enamine deaminase RidA (YjgF/YER057c/UK114 family)